MTFLLKKDQHTLHCMNFCLVGSQVKISQRYKEKEKGKCGAIC